MRDEGIEWVPDCDTCEDSQFVCEHCHRQKFYCGCDEYYPLVPCPNCGDKGCQGTS